MTMDKLKITILYFTMVNNKYPSVYPKIPIPIGRGESPNGRELHRSLFESDLVSSSAGIAPPNNEINTSPKHNPTKYTNPLISLFITEDKVKKQTTIKGDKRKNR